MSLWRLFRGAAPPDAGPAYAVIVAQARQAAFYDGCAVPDSVDGRFDLIALHAFLVLRRLKAEGEATAPFRQALFDTMFTDMDRNLREMGAGDLGVGRRVKAMAKAFYGRIAAYEEGLRDGPAALAAALRRNVYREAAPPDASVAALAAYVQAAAARLAAVPADAVQRADFTFGPVARPASAA